MHRGRRLGVAASAAALALTLAPPAAASAPHVVQPGETLSSIAAANGLTTRTVAVFNGLGETAPVAVGETIQVPTVDEGEAALVDAGITPGAPSAGTSASGAGATGQHHAGAPAIPAAPGMGHIPSPWGDLHLDPAAADAWNAMRQESLEVYGVELHPAGTASAYRTYEQQAHFYDLFISGEGSPADPPGTSAHELGTAVDVAAPEMRDVIDEIGAKYGWAKVEAPTEWWHVNYVGG